MKIAAAAIMFAGLTIAGAAQAKATDAEYLQAKRCLGLASSEALSSASQADLKAFADAEGRTRTAIVLAKGDEEQRRAAREARTTNDQRIARLGAELSGPCQTLVGAVSGHAQHSGAQPRS